MLGKEHKTWLIGLVAAVALYAVAGFLIAPRAIKLWIESPNVSGPTCRLRVRQVYVNPFTMSLSLQNVTLFEQENKLLVSAALAETSIWTAGMWRSEKPGRDIAIQGLVVTRRGSTETVLAAPRASANNVSVDAGTCIAFDELTATGGRLQWTDHAVTPRVQLELRDVVAEARRESSAASTGIELEGRIGPTGSIRVTTGFSGPAVDDPDRFSLVARNVDLQPFSPYSRRLYGRDIANGLGDITLRHERDGTTISQDARLGIAGLRLGELNPANAASTLPLDLALALATDTADYTRLSFRGSASGSRAHGIARVFVNGLTTHLEGLAARPFEVLAGLAGDTDAVVDTIPFLPGSAEMAPAAMDTLKLLATALGQRARLDMSVRPSYDPVADRDAIAAQQIRLHIALATSASPGDRGDVAGPDFGDRRVRDILDEFASKRLSAARRRTITRGVSDETTMYRDIYLALIANERVSETVLRRLARFRARSVIDALERQGIDRNRFAIADALDVTAADAGTVSVKLEVKARPALHDDHDDKPGSIER